jgi:hypothetical protein
LVSVDVYEDMVAVGGSDGNVYLSDDSGDTFGDAMSAGGDDAYVAFGPDGTLYAACEESTVKVYDADEEEFVDLEDSTEGTATTPDGFVGIWVSPDDVVYALTMGSTGTGGTSGTADTYALDVAHGASLQVQAADSGGTATIDMLANADNTINVLTGTFVDGEVLNVVGGTLIYLPPGVHGAIVVEGAESGATGYVAIFAIPTITSGIVLPGEALVVIGSFLDVDVTAGSSGTADTPAADVCLWRLLIGEDDNVWENACIEGEIIAENLWGTTGSNILWTFTNPEDEYDVTPGDLGDLGIWALEDFLTGAVDLVSPADGSRIASSSKATLEWEEMDTAGKYELGGDFEDVTATTKTKVDVSGLSDNTTYDWKVRVSTPWTSRWSDMWEFTTLDEVDTPVNMVPVNGMQDAPLMPSFMWSDVSGATNYTFELSTDPTFATGVTSVSATINAYTWAGGDLVNDQDYYWRVRAYNSSTGGVSDWCLSNFHTRMAPTDPVVVTQTTTNITLTQQPAETPETPAYIWIIIVIGAILTIAVIVLIVRTRRVV